MDGLRGERLAVFGEFLAFAVVAKPVTFLTVWHITAAPFRRGHLSLTPCLPAAVSMELHRDTLDLACPVAARSLNEMLGLSVSCWLFRVLAGRAE